MKKNVLFLVLLLKLLFLTCSVMAQPAEPVEGIPLRVYSCVLNSRATTIEPGTRFEMFINYENCSREPIAAGEVMLNCPEGVSLITNEGSQLVESVAPHGTVGKNYVMAVSRMCDKYILPFEVWISNREGRLVKCYTIQLRMGQSANTSLKANIVDAVSCTEKNLKDGEKDNHQNSTISYLTEPGYTSQQTDGFRGKDRCVVTASRLNVRKNASASANVIGTVIAGDTLFVLACENGWCKIKKKEVEGFVSEKYVKKICDYGIDLITQEVYDTPAIEQTAQSLQDEENRISDYQEIRLDKTRRNKSNGVVMPGTGFWFADDIIRWEMTFAAGTYLIDNFYLAGGLSYQMEWPQSILAHFIKLPVYAGYSIGKRDNGDIIRFGISVSAGTEISYLIAMKYAGEKIDLSGATRVGVSGILRLSIILYLPLYVQYEFPLTAGGLSGFSVGVTLGGY